MKHSAPALPKPSRLLATLVMVLSCASAWPADAPLPAPLAAPVFAQAPARPAPVRTSSRKAESTPTWRELTPPQQQALAPLAGTWASLTATHKRKWLALSANYPALPPAEQARLHSRMGEWAALSPQQRTQARLNFAESKAVPKGDKKAKWEAYQALPPEEKRKLAAGARTAKPAAPATAAAVRPVPRQKLATVPKPAKASRSSKRAPPIAGDPGEVDRNTLLPHPGALQAP